MPYTKLTKEQELRIIRDHYKEDLSSNALQKKYHVSAKRLEKIFNNHGVKLKKNLHKSKYSFNKEFFYQESQELAYFLGLLSSDGFIQSNCNLIGIELQASDKHILEDISKAMNFNRNVRDFIRKERGSGRFCRFQLENSEIKKLLIEKYSITPNKTNKDFCFNFQNLSSFYWKDFIRGYFDGDGCIKMTGKNLTFQIDSVSLKMLLAIEKSLKSVDDTIEFGITIRKKKTEEENSKLKIKHFQDLYRLCCYNTNAKKIFNILYKDATIFLNRKHEKYLQYVK